MPGFWEHADLWMNQVVAGVITGALCGFLGVWVVLRRVVFLSAALGEVAGLGVVMAFFLALGLAPPEEIQDQPPGSVALAEPEPVAESEAETERAPSGLTGVVSDDELAAFLSGVGVQGAGLAVGTDAWEGPPDARSGSAGKLGEGEGEPSARARSAVFGERGIEPYEPSAAAANRDAAAEHAHQWVPMWLQPMLVAVVFVVVAATMLSIAPRYRRITQESVIGVAYLVAAGVVILVGSRIPQGTHEIRHVLYGDSVSLDPAQLRGLLVAAGVVAVLHGLFFKEFLFVSFDPESARASGIATRLMSVLIMVSIGIVIASAAHAVGALPVFAFLVLPPVAALLCASSLRSAFAVSAAIGGVASALGYYLAWVWSFPAGACRVVTAAAFVVPALAIRLAKRT